MRKVMIFVVAAATLTLDSCNRNDETTPAPTAPWGAGYLPAYPGNYWVYGHYKIDTTGNEVLLNAYDSLAVTGKTWIAGKEYIVFEGTWMSGPEFMDTVMLLRDSAGCYVDPQGAIHFSYMNFDDTLFMDYGIFNAAGDTLYARWYMMDSDPQWVTVDAGTFEALNYKGTVYTYNPNPGVPVEREEKKMFSQNVGIVLSTYYYLGSPNRHERRLQRYHVGEKGYD
jgi:hypothetical protein